MKNKLTFGIALLATVAQAQFTANNLAVLKITSPTAIGNVGVSYETRVVEFTTAGVATGRNLSMIVDTAKFVVEERPVAHEGQLNLTKDGRYLTAVGYNAAPGLPAGTIRVAEKRIARINSAGIVDLSTRVPVAFAFGGVGVRSAVSEDGSKYWVNSSSNALAHAVRAIPHGGNTSTLFTAAQYRSLSIFGGVIYGSPLSSQKLFSHDTSGVATELNIDGIRGPEYCQFLFLDASPAIPGNDLLYVADRNSGIRKFSLEGAAWRPVSDSSGIYNPTIGSTAGFFALTGKMENGKPTLYGIKILLVGGVYTSSHLIKIVDNAARNEDWNLPASLPTATELASTTNLEQFKGVAFTPVGSSGVNEVANIEPLIIQPTAAQDAIQILVGDKKTAIQIFNIAGQQVLTTHMQGTTTLDVHFLPAGLYVVRAETGAVGRFVKQ
jgi:hypothetical protein